MPAIAFDADDTLWHNQPIYETAAARLREILAPYHPAGGLDRRLYETELANLPLYGYGIKSFTLSNIETAIRLSNGKITAAGIHAILALGREMLGHPVELLPAAAEIIPRLARDHTLLLITKGDLLDQRRKLEKSGLAPHFHRVEIVTEKNTAAYADILARHGIAPADFLMVGNSVKSDLLPVLALGGAAVHIPYSLLWEHERADGIPAGHPRLRTLESLAQLPALLEKGFPPAEK